MKFNLIGSGNVAWFLGKKLTSAGHKCVGVYGRTTATVVDLANELSAEAYSNIAELKDNVDCCIIAVPDQAIPEIAGKLSFKETVLIHTAGSVEINSLSGCASHYGELWPIYSIVKGELPLHNRIPTVWEASDEKAKDVILEIANCFSDITFEADATKRSWLHMTAVISNNFITHLVAVCEKICINHGIPFALLQPILQQTFERMESGNVERFQTGPARRKDDSTMKKHIDFLQDDAEFQQVYKSISSSIEKMYHEDK